MHLCDLWRVEVVSAEHGAPPGDGVVDGHFAEGEEHIATHAVGIEEEIKRGHVGLDEWAEDMQEYRLGALFNL